MANGLHPVDQFALIVMGFEILVAGVLDQAGDPLQGPIPVLLLPFVALRRPVEDLAQAVLIDLGQAEDTGTLGAERSFVDGWSGSPSILNILPVSLSALQISPHPTEQ